MWYCMQDTKLTMDMNMKILLQMLTLLRYFLQRPNGGFNITNAAILFVPTPCAGPALFKSRTSAS